MPGVVLFKRRWEFASDDLVFPGIFEFFVRTLWLIVISAVFHVNRSTLDCSGGPFLEAYYVGTLVLLSVCLLLDIVIVYISMQGTITNIRPRRRIPLLLYIKLAIGIPELAWTIMGTYWAFGMSYGCDREVVGAVKALVLCGWIAFLFVVISLVILFDPLGKKKLFDQQIAQSSLVSGDGQQFMGGASTAATRVWETRCKILCCCVGCEEETQSAFSDVAKLMTLFFQDVDLVPTDVGAGLILLHQQQAQQASQLTNVHSVSFPATVPAATSAEGTRDTTLADTISGSSSRDTTLADTISGSSSTNVLPVPSYVLSSSSIHLTPTSNTGSTSPPLKSWMNIALATHYMKYAMASYGWPLYVFSNLLTGVCKLYPQCRCCNCMYGTGSVLRDNSCQCHTAAIKKFTGLKAEDLIYASFHNRIYEIPFFVSIDREKNAVVISIRGTMSLKDALTDMTAECSIVTIDGVTDCYAHKGILSAATFIFTQLQQLHLLEEAFSKGQEMDLVVCGHSLGGGTAVLLAILLRPKYPGVRCFSYSPPGGLLSPTLSVHSLDYVFSVVLGHDFIPRLSLVTVEDLKMKLLKAIGECNSPKYKVLLGGCWRVLCGVPQVEDSHETGSESGHSLLDNSHSPNSSYSTPNISSNEAIRDAIMSSNRSRITQPPLLPPGQILHIVELEGRKSWFESPQYSAVWSHRELFDEIIVSPKMVSHHLPDSMMKALSQLNERNFKPNARVQEKSRVQHL